MREQRVEIEIDENGRIKADAHGFLGDACIKDLEKLLADCGGAWLQVERKQPERPSTTAAAPKTNLRTGGQP